MTKADKKKYPMASARVSFEWEKRFKALLQFVQQDQPTVEPPILLRMLLGDDTRIEVKREWREYLSGKTSALEKDLKRRSA